MDLKAEGRARTATVTGGLVPDSVYLRVGTMRLHCLLWGVSADPLAVLIHGNGGHAHWWDPIVRALVPGWRLIVPDLRGHGESDWAEPPRYRIEDFSADLLGLLDQLDDSRQSAVGGRQSGIGEGKRQKGKMSRAAIRTPPEVPVTGHEPRATSHGSRATRHAPRVVLIGHSMGGRVCAWIAMQHPERVRALALLDTRLGGVDAKTAPRDRGRIAGQRHGRGYGTCAEAIAAFRFVPDEPHVAPDIVADLALHAVYERGPGDWTFRFDRAVLALDGDGAGDLFPSLDRIRCPTLLVNGDRSWVMDAQECDRLKAAIPQSVIHTSPGGHHFLVAHPTAVGTLLRGFMDCSRP